ncbi:MAG: pyrimidine dimer DNA glycosylase/endonuclease V [Corynebacterium sp.]|uniref:pyrimidine dimer DNA glycosylase/endonuclease V n=1 Tax=unclassified Corynebacterium TaxID=2624378 RepID=UPI002647A060|nr:pyrimidine dimer DNA glycosylase/endonuclease V [Corynebacterium sp.]MDN5720998.1 pyrimidine dimer DNA glycosylase/endonuclease V [Corynebacterium sp.]MDN6258376.1 pyrimidine dimer DNA glycosylase/endonuclease V [Corynebacterium sp.]MDN6324585.1 pyrimidine dimer DNA glycosylase/endonuclease V [Corynebacterium sp.]MDN6387093.1 pyrimidine dimer DNA glycosylase/endonuclease V [Corynebacterium sp.]MDN6509952.1 pyrimidine dimer DNA glycosylase/endonuclease V [Corynebacterium sp.]
MRLWSLDPSILDRAALVACWREALLAQKVLEGGTRGYTAHPQLRRFRAQDAPTEAIAAYLWALREEATARGYRFDGTRIHGTATPDDLTPVPVTGGQLAYELEHLRRKVTERAPEWLDNLPDASLPDDEIPAHPLLRVVAGEVEDWEVVSDPRR